MGSCDLRADERPRKKFKTDRQTDRQRYVQTSRLLDQLRPKERLFKDERRKKFKLKNPPKTEEKNYEKNRLKLGEKKI